MRDPAIIEEKHVPVIETARLKLRPLALDDFELLHRCASDPDIVQYMIWGNYDKDETVRFLRQCEDDWSATPQKRYPFAIVLKETGEAIGACWLQLEENLKCGELSWVLHSDWWHRGYMSEAAVVFLGFCFKDLGLHRVYAHARVENSGSYKIMEKLGMRREALYRKLDPVRFSDTESWADVYLYAILEEDYFNA